MTDYPHCSVILSLNAALISFSLPCAMSLWLGCCKMSDSVLITCRHAADLRLLTYMSCPVRPETVGFSSRNTFLGFAAILCARGSFPRFVFEKSHMCHNGIRAWATSRRKVKTVARLHPLAYFLKYSWYNPSNNHVTKPRTWYLAGL